MARSLIPSAIITTALLLAGCGKPADKSATETPAAASSQAGRKCPDPNIRDPKDPCSPYYWKPKDSALKNAKSF
jgi:hypothetical protein